MSFDIKFSYTSSGGVVVKIPTSELPNGSSS